MRRRVIRLISQNFHAPFAHIIINIIIFIFVMIVIIVMIVMIVIMMGTIIVDKLKHD